MKKKRNINMEVDKQGMNLNRGINDSERCTILNWRDDQFVFFQRMASVGLMVDLHVHYRRRGVDSHC